MVLAGSRWPFGQMHPLFWWVSPGLELWTHSHQLQLCHYIAKMGPQTKNTNPNFDSASHHDLSSASPLKHLWLGYCSFVNINQGKIGGKTQRNTYSHFAKNKKTKELNYPSQWPPVQPCRTFDELHQPVLGPWAPGPPVSWWLRSLMYCYSHNLVTSCHENYFRYLKMH